MPRGIAWDTLPKWYTNPLQKHDAQDAPVSKEPIDPNAPREVNFEKDMTAIGKRFAFGSICGGLTGASFGMVDALRDTKNLKGNSKLVSTKVLRYTGIFTV